MHKCWHIHHEVVIELEPVHKYQKHHLYGWHLHFKGSQRNKMSPLALTFGQLLSEIINLQM